jgi:biotin carboxyl carrier protein
MRYYVTINGKRFEVDVVADVAGTMKAINVKKGDSVTTGQALVVIG